MRNTRSHVLVKAARGGQRAGHKYIRRKPKPGGGFIYEYPKKKPSIQQRVKEKEIKKEKHKKALAEAKRRWGVKADAVFYEHPRGRGTINPYLVGVRPEYILQIYGRGASWKQAFDDATRRGHGVKEETLPRTQPEAVKLPERLDVQGYGRVGSYAAARTGHFSRGRKYWAVVWWDDSDIPSPSFPGLTQKVGWKKLENHPTFKTKKEAQKYLDELRAGQVKKSLLLELPDGWMMMLKAEHFEWSPDGEAEAVLEKAGARVAGKDLKALYAGGAKWITLKETRQHVLIMPFDDHFRVIAGAGGALEHLKLTSVKKPEEFREEAKLRAVEKRKKERARIERLSAKELEREREKVRGIKAAKKKIRERFHAYVQEKTGVSTILTKEKKAEVKAVAKTEAEESPKVKAAEDPREKRAIVATKVGEAVVNAEKQQAKEAAQARRTVIREARGVVLSTLRREVLEEDPIASYEDQKEAAAKEGVIEKPSEIKLDYEEAMEILKHEKAYERARKEFNKKMPRLDAKVFDLETIGVEISDAEIIKNELEGHVRLQRALLNHEFYEHVQAHDGAMMERKQSEGAVASLNAIASEVLDETLIDEQLVKTIGISAAAQMVAHRIWQQGKHKKIIEALKEELISRNVGIVEKALAAAQDMYHRKGALQELGTLQPAELAGHHLSNINRAIEQLGSASGSLEGAATVLHALMREPRDEVKIDVGTSALSAEMKAKKLGLKRADYSLDHAPGGRWTLRIKASGYPSVLNAAKADAYSDKVLGAIRRRDKNEVSWKPGGITDTLKDGTKVNLTPDQQAGIRFAMERMKRAQHKGEKSGTIWDFRPGTGKTLMAIGMAGEAIEQGLTKRVLLTVPSRLANEFQKEHAKFSDGKYKFGVITGETKGRMKKGELQRMVENSNIHVLVVGHDTLRTKYLPEKELRKYQKAQSSKYRAQGMNPYQATKRAKADRTALEERNSIDNAINRTGDFNLVMGDEAHEFFTKVPAGEEAKAVSQRREALHGVETQHRIAMTGTVTRNMLDSFMSMTEWAQPGAFQRQEFLDKYGDINQGTTIFQRASVKAFRKEVSPLMMSAEVERKHKVDHIVKRVKPTKEQRKHMTTTQERYREARAHQDKGMRRGAALRRDEEHRKTMHNRDHKNNAIVQDVMRTIEKKGYPERNEAGVFVSYNKDTVATMGAALTEKYGKESWKKFSGDESATQREEILKDFNEGRIKFLVGTQALATGLNLQTGKYIVNMDLPHTAADQLQRNRRVDRKGQTKDVDIHTYYHETPAGFRGEDKIDTRKRVQNIFGDPSAYDDTPLAHAVKRVRELKAEERAA